MRAITFALTLVGGLFLFNSANADSPITSTYFCTEYFDIDLVKQASEQEVINQKMIQFLLDETTDLGAKAALINALSWDIDGKNNADLLEKALVKKYNTTQSELDHTKLSASELMALAYLKAMDNYFEVDEALRLSELAARKDRTSYTIHMVNSLIKSQHLMSQDFCSVYEMCASVQFNETLNADFRAEAEAKIFKYIDIYKDACSAERVEEAQNPELAPAFFEAAHEGDLDVIKDFLGSGLEIDAKNKAGMTAFLIAADKGQLKTLKYLAEQGADMTAEDSEGNNALMFAANGVGTDYLISSDDAEIEAKANAFALQVEQLPQVIDFLVEQGIDVNAVNAAGGTAFSIAASKGKVELMEKLLEHGALPDVRDENGRTALMYATFYDRMESVQFLTGIGMDPDDAESDGYSAYIIAAETGHEDIVRHFVENNLIDNIDAQLNEGSSALYRALMNDHTDIAVFLMNNGADPNLYNEEGYNPFVVALAHDDLPTAKYMVQQGADVNAMIRNEFRLATLFCTNDEPIILKFLVDYGADINLTDEDGNTPLMEASRKGKEDHAKYLLSIDADVNALDNSQRSALDYAANEGHTDLCQMLIANGAEVNKRDVNNATPLMHAASGGNFETVILLVEKRAKVNAADNKMCTPLIYASKNGDVQIVEYLLKKRAKINVADHNGTTALMFATQHIDLCEFLLDQKKLKIDQTNNDGQTALMMAAATEVDFAIEMLLGAGADTSIEDHKGRNVLAYAQTDGVREYIMEFMK